MKYGYNLAGVGEAVLKTFHVGATVTAGSPVMKDTNKYGDVIPVAATASADAMGLAISGGTYSTSTLGTCEVVVNPYAVLVGRCAGAATGGTLLSAATKNVLTQTSASTTVVTDTTNVSTVDFVGGTMFGLTGANAGARRVLTSRVSATSCTVTVAFANSVAVGDKVAVIPFGIGSRDVRLTTNFLEWDAFTSTIGSNAISCAIVDVTLELPINSTNPEILAGAVLLDTCWNTIN